jgi:hypothetical protein
LFYFSNTIDFTFRKNATSSKITLCGPRGTGKSTKGKRRYARNFRKDRIPGVKEKELGAIFPEQAVGFRDVFKSSLNSGIGTELEEVSSANGKYVTGDQQTD